MINYSDTEMAKMRETGCPWLKVAKLDGDKYWRVYTHDMADDGTVGEISGYTGMPFTSRKAATAYAIERCENGTYHGFGHAEAENSGLLWHYRSTLRPVTALPLAKLEWEFCEEFLGPDVRDMLTRRQLTEDECWRFDLQLIGRRAA